MEYFLLTEKKYSWYFTSADNEVEVRGVFLNIPKAFDKLLHDRLI